MPCEPCVWIVNTELQIERMGVVTTLTLNRPDKANALSAALVEALAGAVDAAHHDGTRLLVIKGDGRNFCAGFDFGGFEDASEGDLLLRFVRIETMLQAVYHAPFATLALAQGKNFGAGVDLALACGTRIAAPGAEFRMPGLKFGLQLGTRRLALFAEAFNLLGTRNEVEEDPVSGPGFRTPTAVQPPRSVRLGLRLEF